MEEFENVYRSRREFSVTSELVKWGEENIFVVQPLIIKNQKQSIIVILSKRIH